MGTVKWLGDARERRMRRNRFRESRYWPLEKWDLIMEFHRKVSLEATESKTRVEARVLRREE